MTKRRTSLAAFCSTLGLLLCLGCQSLTFTSLPVDKLDKGEREQVLQSPTKRSLRVSQYVFLSDFELKPDLPLFRELADLREQLHKELKLPPSNTVIQVYLFDDRERYERFMHAKYPDLPKRRAFFVAQPRAVGGTEDLLVYTYWGDRIRQDLRHELTHALLHSVLKDVPLWLDEGLAEYFEVPPEAHGLNQTHIEQIQLVSGESFKPDLSHLEQLSQVPQMTPPEYREAWAWVHLMLRGKPEAKAVLIQYIQQLRANPSPGPLQPRLAAAVSDPETALVQHLAQLTNDSRSVPAARR